MAAPADPSLILLRDPVYDDAIRCSPVQRFKTLPSTVFLRECYFDVFNKKLSELEEDGYVSRWETYKITPELHPDTGIEQHVYTMELYKAGE